MAADKRCTSANNLIAVLLVTRSRPGPRLAFHYPPTPRRTPATTGNKQADDGDSDDESESDTEDVISKVDPNSETSNRLEKTRSGNDGSKTNGTDIAGAQSSVLGLSEDNLEKLLSPGCWSDRKKFEVCLDGMTFVGYPVFADHDGSWARGYTHEPSRKFALTPTQSPEAKPSQPSEAQSTPAINITKSKEAGTQVHDFNHVPESLDSRVGSSLATSFNSESTTSPAVPEPLTMFHVVFVLGPRTANSRDDEAASIYEQVAKKVTKALQYCQKQSSYVGFESRKLLALKTKAKQLGIGSKELCDQSLEASELARALRELYERLSKNDIAGIRLNSMNMSVQLPHSDPEDGSEETLGQDSGLLLLDEKESLLRELADPDASPLAYFIREHTPTKSLRKLANRFGLPIDNVLYLARHVVKWRKARIITPLHPRNSYVVSAKAPLDRLDHHISQYSQKFSALPSLPQMLKILSGKPIRYGMLIPSRDHRAPYMDILAYLVRHNFVDQLKTFGWLQASAAVETREAETEMNQNRRPLSVLSLLSPQMRPADDDTVSISSERTAIPLSSAHAEHGRDRKTSSVPSMPSEAQLETFEIITKPHEFSTVKMQRLERIRESVMDEELGERLLPLVHYFDGEHALENIAASEGLKGAKVEAWLDVLQREGFMLTFRRT